MCGCVKENILLYFAIFLKNYNIIIIVISSSSSSTISSSSSTISIVVLVIIIISRLISFTAFVTGRLIVRCLPLFRFPTFHIFHFFCSIFSHTVCPAHTVVTQNGYKIVTKITVFKTHPYHLWL